MSNDPFAFQEANAYRAGGPSRPMPVRVVDFDMPFTRMVVFMVKWALASIPAALILGLIFTFVFYATMAVLVGLGLAAHSVK
jgi:hypothetical protein